MMQTVLNVPDSNSVGLSGKRESDGEATFYLKVGNSKLTRRILSICRKRRLSFTEDRVFTRIYGRKYAHKLIGYKVPWAIYNEVWSQIKFEEAVAKRTALAKRIIKLYVLLDQDSEVICHPQAPIVCKAFGIQSSKSKQPAGIRVPAVLSKLVEELSDCEELEQQVEVVEEFFIRQRKLAKREAFIKRFPLASQETIDMFIDEQNRSCTVEDVPLHFLTREEIDDLKLVCGRQVSTLIGGDGAKVLPLFAATFPPYSPTCQDIENRAEQHCLTPQRALWAANKLVKIVPSKRKSEVYALKDRLLKYWSSFLVEGRVAREEVRECFNCWEQEYSDCERCGGTGIYSSRTLYEHLLSFPGDERSYSFHSYVKPAVVSEVKGADKQNYGYRFSPSDRDQISNFHFEELLLVLKNELSRLSEPISNVC